MVTAFTVVTVWLQWLRVGCSGHGVVTVVRFGHGVVVVVTVWSRCDVKSGKGSQGGREGNQARKEVKKVRF